MKGWLGLVVWSIAGSLPTKWPPVNHRLCAGQEGPMAIYKSICFLTYLLTAYLLTVLYKTGLIGIYAAKKRIRILSVNTRLQKHQHSERFIYDRETKMNKKKLKFTIIFKQYWVILYEKYKKGFKHMCWTYLGHCIVLCIYFLAYFKTNTRQATQLNTNAIYQGRQKGHEDL